MRYSLRCAILGISFLACVLALWSNSASRQRQTVTEIYALGGSVEYQYGRHWFLEPILDVHFVAQVSVVYLYNYDPSVVDPGFAGYVRDVDALIPHLQRLVRLQRVISMSSQSDAARRLRSALPGVDIEIGLGGII